MSKVILMLALLFLCSCQDSFNFDENCIDCGGTPIKPKPDPIPTPPSPPTEDRYTLGYQTGINDATTLFNATFYPVPCTLGGDGEDWEFDDAYEQFYTQINYTSTPTCLATTSSQKNAFNDFIIQYRLNLQNKIDQGQDVNFNTGLLNGFNYKILEYSVNFGISIP